MIKINIISLIFILTSALFAQNLNDAFRLGEQNLDYDARTLSLGNSTIGSFGNFSSSLINPAGLGTVKRDIFSMSFNSNGFKNSTEFINSSMISDRNNGNVNQISLVMPLPVKRGSAVVAFGYSQGKDFNSILEFNAFNNSNTSMIQDLTAFNDDIAYELGVSYPVFDSNDEYIEDETSINGRLHQSGKLIEKGSSDSWIMAGAAEIAKNLYVGGTFNIISGDYTSNRTYQEDDYDNDIYDGLLDPSDPNTTGFESFFINDIIDWDISGWDFRLGLLYKTDGILNFGATVKFPTYYTIEERYSIYGESYFTQNYFEVNYPGEVFEYEISTPMEYSGGFSASFPFVTLNASAKFVDYSQMEFTHGFDKDELFEKNNVIEELFESTINWNLGAEFTLPYPAFKIRGGFIYKPSPYIDDDPEFDKKYITAGVGFPIAKKLLFDFAYVHGWWNNYGDNYDVEVSRTLQDINLNKLVFSVSYIFM